MAAANGFHPAHVRPQHLRHGDRSVRLLVVLHHRDQGASDGHARSVQGVNIGDRLAVRSAAEAGVHAARLEVPAVRAGGDFPVHLLAWQPDFQVMRAGRGKPGIAG